MRRCRDRLRLVVESARAGQDRAGVLQRLGDRLGPVDGVDVVVDCVEASLCFGMLLEPRGALLVALQELSLSAFEWGPGGGDGGVGFGGDLDAYFTCLSFDSSEVTRPCSPVAPGEQPRSTGGLS